MLGRCRDHEWVISSIDDARDARSQHCTGRVMESDDAGFTAKKLP
jgi:hypothetical protein